MPGMVPLNMFGTKILLSGGSSVSILPYDGACASYEDPYDRLDNYTSVVTIIVQTIRFAVGRNMLTEQKSPRLETNYFTDILAKGTKKEPIAEISIDSDDAECYPLIFDFLRRRLTNDDAQVHTAAVNKRIIDAMDPLMAKLFPEFGLTMLPINSANPTVQIAIPPPCLLSGVQFEAERDRMILKRKHDVDICLDPEFVSLAKRANAKLKCGLIDEDAAREALEGEDLGQFVKKFNIRTISPLDVVTTTLVSVERGQPFTLLEKESPDGLCSIRVAMQSNYDWHVL